MHTAALTKKMLQNSLAGLKKTFFQAGSHWPAVMVLAVVFTAACFCVPGMSAGSEIRIADSRGDWGYPNPFRHYPRGPGYVRMSWVFDTLVWKDKNGYVPALADTWSYDPERKAFVFTLNPRAKWHDSHPVTAQDVVFTIAYFKQHPYRWISTHALDRAEAVDDRTVVIYLAMPYAPFLSDIGGTMPVLPQHIWETVSDPLVFEDPSAFIGSGPYVFRDFSKTQGTYLFEAFPDYYQGPPKKDRLVYVRSGKPMMSLMTGQVDLANIRPDMAETLQKKGLAVIENEHGWNKKIMINHKKAPFTDPVFRRALAYAINRQEIIDRAHRGFAVPASHGLLSIDHEMYNPDTPQYPWNPQKAADMIASLGWTRKPDGFFYKNGQVMEIELISSNLTVAGERVADRDGEIIKKQLTDIGIRIHLRNLEQTTTDSRVKNWDFDLAISGHGGIAGDPRILSEMISPVYGAGSVNSARFDDNQELNRLLEAQLAEMDPDRRKQMVFKIQTLYAEQMPAISLYYPDTMAAFNQNKDVTWFYTRGGISKGIPVPQNKMSLIR